MNNKKNHERLFPEDEQVAEELANLVSESVVLELMNISPKITMDWGRQVRMAYGITDEIEQYYEALEFGIRPTSVREVNREDGYDVGKRIMKRDRMQYALVKATLALNGIAAKHELSPVLPGAETMCKDDMIRHLYAYYEARIKRNGLGKYETSRRRNTA